MAINHADQYAMLSILACPVVAGIAAVSAHAGWFAPVFAVVGIAAGFGVASVVAAIAYWFLGTGPPQGKREWLIAPLFLGYVIFPPLIAVAGCVGVWFGTFWLVKHLL